MFITINIESTEAMNFTWRYENYEMEWTFLEQQILIVIFCFIAGS